MQVVSSLCEYLPPVIEAFLHLAVFVVQLYRRYLPRWVQRAVVAAECRQSGIALGRPIVAIPLRGSRVTAP